MGALGSGAASIPTPAGSRNPIYAPKPDRAANIGRPALRSPIMRRPRVDRVDNREPGTTSTLKPATEHKATSVTMHSSRGSWRRRDLAYAPIPHRRRGLDGRPDPGPLGAPATRLRSALSRGQFAPQP